MKQEEVIYLRDLKEHEGKSAKQITYEINNLSNSQRIFKNLVKENKRLNKLIETKDKTIENLKKKKLVDKETNFKDKFKKLQDEIDKTNKNDYIRVRDLNRVMSILGSEDKIGLCDLQRTCVINTEDCKKILVLLTKGGFIKENLEGRTIIIERIKGGINNG